MRKLLEVALLGACVLVTACNTVHGAGQDVKSVGRVFSKHPNDSADERSHP